MGCNLLRHAYNHFDTHEAQHQYSITVLIYCHIHIHHRSLLCACAVYVHTRACVCVCACVDISVYMYIRTSVKISNLLEYVKIYHRSRTLDKHSRLAIFDKHLLRLTNQGLPKILPQYPLETTLTVT